jgi:hypothetical protein
LSIALRAVARLTSHQDVIEDIFPAFDARDDVVDFKRAAFVATVAATTPIARKRHFPQLQPRHLARSLDRLALGIGLHRGDNHLGCGACFEQRIKNFGRDHAAAFLTA